MPFLLDHQEKRVKPKKSGLLANPSLVTCCFLSLLFFLRTATGSSGKSSFYSRSWTTFNLFPYTVRICFTSSTVFLSCKLHISPAACWEKKETFPLLLLFSEQLFSAKKSSFIIKNKQSVFFIIIISKNNRSRRILATPGHGLICQSCGAPNLTFLLTMQPPDRCQAGKPQIDESIMSKKESQWKSVCCKNEGRNVACGKKKVVFTLFRREKYMLPRIFAKQAAT